MSNLDGVVTALGVERMVAEDNLPVSRGGLQVLEKLVAKPEEVALQVGMEGPNVVLAAVRVQGEEVYESRSRITALADDFMRKSIILRRAMP